MGGGLYAYPVTIHLKSQQGHGINSTFIFYTLYWWRDEVNTFDSTCQKNYVAKFDDDCKRKIKNKAQMKYFSGFFINLVFFLEKS